jgi:hypothetical protein
MANNEFNEADKVPSKDKAQEKESKEEAGKALYSDAQQKPADAAAKESSKLSADWKELSTKGSYQQAFDRYEQMLKDPAKTLEEYKKLPKETLEEMQKQTEKAIDTVQKAIESISKKLLEVTPKASGS